MIGGRIRAARPEAGLSLREVARRILMNPGYLSQIEHGLRVPSPGMLADLGGVLGVDLVAVAAEPAPVRLNTDALAGLGATLGTQRRLEDTIGAAPLVAPTVAQFTGWLHTAVQRYGEAERWFSRSLEWAMEAGDYDLVATVLSFKGHVAWLRGQPGPTLGLSQAARRRRQHLLGPARLRPAARGPRPRHPRRRPSRGPAG